MRIVTFNGPLGCGKSWVCDRLEERFAGSGIQTRRVSFQDPLRIATMALLGATGMNYDVFKKHIFMGLTGRQWMINMSEKFAKNYEPNFFKIRLIEEMEKFHEHRTLFLADSLGFPEELDYLRSRMDIDVLACCIEPVDSPVRGHPWMEGDSRFNLAHKCGIVAPNSTSMLPAVLEALSRRGWSKYAA